MEVLKTPHRAPKANVVCDLFLGSVRRECLDPLPVVGQGQLSGSERIRRTYQLSTATPGDWAEDSRGDPTPASLAEARKAHHGSGP